MDAHNTTNRIFRKVGKALVTGHKARMNGASNTANPNPVGSVGRKAWDIGWADYDSRWGAKINWHSFRHTAVTWAETEGMMDSDQQAFMGHGDRAMTRHYTHADLERQHAVVERIAQKLFGIEADSATVK